MFIIVITKTKQTYELVERELSLSTLLVVTPTTIPESHISVTPPRSNELVELERQDAIGSRYMDCRTLSQGPKVLAALAVTTFGVGATREGSERPYTRTTSLYFGEYVGGT